VRAEQGEEGVRDLAEGLALLRQQGGRYAAYWRCPCCDTRLLSAEAFVQHLQVRLSLRVVGWQLGAPQPACFSLRSCFHEGGREAIACRCSIE